VPRVLVIDDQPEVRAAVVVAMKALRFDVATAEDGMSALRVFQDGPFDLVIADVYMPGLDGVRLIKALRDIEPNLPVIAMSGVMLKGSEHTALDFLPGLPALSNVACLKKPFRSRDLLQAIQTAMAVAA
jgi:CheY-like chemotaxis protein